MLHHFLMRPMVLIYGTSVSDEIASNAGTKIQASKMSAARLQELLEKCNLTCNLTAIQIKSHKKREKSAQFWYVIFIFICNYLGANIDFWGEIQACKFV
jgi:hypothetical protein